MTSSWVGASSPRRVARDVPELLHGALAVHEPDDEVRRGREPVEAVADADPAGRTRSRRGTGGGGSARGSAVAASAPATRYQERAEERAVTARSRQPRPQREPHPVDHLARPDPREQAPARPRSCPRLPCPAGGASGRVVQARLHPEVVAAVPGRRHRRDLLHRERDRRRPARPRAGAARAARSSRRRCRARRPAAPRGTLPAAPPRRAPAPARPARPGLAQVSGHHDAVERRTHARARGAGRRPAPAGRCACCDLRRGDADAGRVSARQRLVALAGELLLLAHPLRARSSRSSRSSSDRQHLALLDHVAGPHRRLADVAVERRDGGPRVEASITVRADTR